MLSGAQAGSGLIPHGGGAVAILIVGIVIAVITATIALEQALVAVSAAVHFLA